MLRVESAVRNAPSVTHVAVGVGPAVFIRHRHLGPRLTDADDFFEDFFEIEALV